MHKMNDRRKTGGNSDMCWYVIGHRSTSGDMHSCLMTKSEADVVYSEWSHDNYFVDVELRRR